MKIQVFVRHCFYSHASAHKKRPIGFSHEKCHDNLMQTADRDKVDFTFLLDTHFSKGGVHFIEQQDNYPVIKVDAGCEGRSFLALLEYVMKQPFDDETILYFLEDDYMHRPEWVRVLREGFSVPCADYVTLYDHRDKYFDSLYKELQAGLFYTDSVHWRTTPSTTNTYAMRFRTLKKHLKFHKRFSENTDISKDHEKFLKLGKKGATLISSVPGWSTHAEEAFASPCFDWSSLIYEESVKLHSN